MAVDLTGDGIASLWRVAISRHRDLNDITRQSLEPRKPRHIGYLWRSEGPGGGVQDAIRSRVQVKAGIRDRRGRRALCQKVALPTTLHIGRTLYQSSVVLIALFPRFGT